MNDKIEFYGDTDVSDQAKEVYERIKKSIENSPGNIVFLGDMPGDEERRKNDMLFCGCPLKYIHTEDDHKRFKCDDCNNSDPEQFSVELHGHNHGEPIAEQRSITFICNKCGSRKNRANQEIDREINQAREERLKSKDPWSDPSRPGRF